MEELKEDYSGLSREKQLELAEEWLEESKMLVEKKYQYLEASKLVKKAITIFEKWKKWELYIEARCLLIGVYTHSLNKNILPNPTNYLEETLSCSQKLCPDFFSVQAMVQHEALDYYVQIGRADTALPYAKEQLKFAKKISPTDYSKIGAAYNDLAYTYNELGAYSRGLQNARKAVQFWEKTPKKDKLFIVLNTLNGCLHSLMKNEEALSTLQEALAIGNSLEEFRASMNMAMLYNNIASSYGRLGDYQQRVLYYQRCLNIVTKHLGQEHFRTASVQHNLGVALMDVGQMEKAYVFLHKALSTHSQVFPPNHPSLALSHQMIAYYYSQLNKYELALPFAQKNLSIHLATNGENHPDTIGAWYNIAITLSNLNRKDESIELLQRCIAQSEVFWGQYHFTTIKYCKSLATIYKGLGKAKEAVSTIQDAEEKLLKNQQEFNASTKLLYLFPILRLKGSIYFQYYLEDTQALGDLQTAVAAFEQAIQILDKLQQTYHNEGSKLVWSASQSLLYQEGLNAALTMGRFSSTALTIAFQFSEKAKASLLLTSLQTELAKVAAQIPEELLNKEKEVKSKLTRLDKLIQRLQSKKEIKKINEYESEELQGFQIEFFDLHQSYTAFLQQLETDYPDYYQLKYDTKTATPTELQSTLAKNQVLISYFIGGESIYIFVITSNEFEVEEINKPNNFELLIQSFLTSIHAHDKTNYLQLAYRLYELLIEPLELHWYDGFGDFLEEEESSSKKQLIIIPHAELSYLPFEALINEKLEGEKVAYQDVNYLVQQYEISYHYSATLWQYAQQSKGERADTDQSFVGFAPVYQADNASIETQEALTAAAKDVRTWATRSDALRSDGTWTPLPHSKEEAENIAALFQQKGLGSETYLHEQATKEQFQEAVGKARYLLVAAHGVVNDEKTALSGLVFYPEKKREVRSEKRETRSGKQEVRNGKQEVGSDLSNLASNISLPSSKTDCILSMEETYPLNIQADLVVLSSCESGIGKLHKGEGMMAVNRGFLAAGAKNVISTLFKVYDKPSSLLTQYLFEAILEGDSYGMALRKAKLKLMEREGVSPKSWCGFVLIGG